MKRRKIPLGYCVLIFLIGITGCSPEEPISEIKNFKAETAENFIAATLKISSGVTNHESGNYTISDFEDLSEENCSITEFGLVFFGYFQDFLQDPYFDFNLMNYYLDLHQKYVTHYRGENYFGENGEYNQLAQKRIRELTMFWNLRREIIVNGQHTASLDDLQILADMIESFDNSIRNREEAYNKAASLLKINALSSNLPESPYFALDAFTKANGLLVIGDGLIESIAAIGVDDEIVFTAIIAHEWWHQAQYEYSTNWNESQGLSKPEASRFIELEADFAAAYFMTHKRGATYNWKRIEDFFKLSFNIGDCLPQSNTHHGTPEQRLNAARLGYELVDIAQKKGFVLSPEEVHSFFIKNLERVY